MTCHEIGAELAEKLAAIGARLRQVREAKAVSLQEVSQQTLIAQRHLEAIEQGMLEVLPEPIYVQGFVRKYAQYLGLGALAEELSLPLSAGHSATNSPSAKLGTLHLYFIYVVVVAGCVSALATAFSGNSYRFEELPPETSGAKPNEIKAVPASPSVPAVGQPLNLTVAMLGESWLRVTVDGKVQFEGILSEGRSLTWSGQRQIVLRVGNGAAVSASFNSSPSKVLGTEGEVVEKIYGKNAPQQSFFPALWYGFCSSDHLG